MVTIEQGRQRYVEMGEPCRNFNILATAVIQDPKDGREKLVLSNFAAGQTGNLVLIDTLTGEGESIGLPGDEGAWGLVNWNNEKLIIGTCPGQAFLHCLDLNTREWAEPLRDENEKYFWDLTLGSDGNVYGGTWPGCSLLQYDPKQHKLVNVGRVSDNEKNMYSRPVNGGVPGYILVAGGYDVPFLKAYNIETGQFRDFGTPGFIVREANAKFIYTVKEDDIEIYDSTTFEKLDDAGLKDQLVNRELTLSNGHRIRAIPLAGGRWAGVRGQDYFIVESLEQEVELLRIPVDAPSTRIHTITTDAKGQIWGACGFGQTIFSYNPVDGSFWNSSSVCNSGGEVYGMRFVDGKLYMSAYVGGDHIVYDPAEPWDQVGNVNPRSLKPVRPDYVRPEGRTVLGPDGGLFTGWSAKYGTYGGAISRINPATLEVDVYKDVIPGQQVAGVAADSRYVYFTTNGGASGLPYQEVLCHFGVWHPEQGLVYSVQFNEGEKTNNGVLASGGLVYVAVGNEIRVFDPERMSFLSDRTLVAEAPCGWFVSLLDGKLVSAFCGKKLLLIDTVSGQVEQEVELPGLVRAAVEHPDGLFFAVGATLYKMEL